MTEDDIKSLWRQGNNNQSVQEVATQIGSVIDKFEKGIKIRDNSEILVAVILIPVFSVVGYYVQPLLSRVGAFLTIPAMLIIICTLRNIKKHKPMYGRISLKEYLEKYRFYMSKQMQALRNVCWWYLLPCAIPMTLFFIGQERYVLAVLLLPLYYYVYRLNRWTIVNELQPMMDRIDQEIRQLNHESD